MIQHQTPFYYSDFRKLNRDFPDVNVDKMIEQCVDLGVWCKNIYRSSGRYSMARLVEQIVSSRRLINSTSILHVGLILVSITN